MKQFKTPGSMCFKLITSFAFLTLGCGNTASNSTSTNGHTLSAHIQEAYPLEPKSSAGFTADYRIANQVDQIPGLQGAVVLLYQSQAFVGVHSIGPDHAPDPNKEKRDYGSNTSVYTVPNGKPASELRNENLNNAALHAEASQQSTITGHIPADRVVQINSLVRSQIPGIRHVYVTAETHEVGRLQAYGRLISQGRDMTPFTAEIRSVLREFWPSVNLT